MNKSSSSKPDSRTFLFVACFLLSSLLLSAQDKPEYSITLLDTSLLRDAHAVIRNEDTRYTIESPRTYTQTTSKAITIFHQNASASYIGVHYNKYSKAEITSIYVYDAFGNLIRKVKKDEIIDVAAYDGTTFLSDERVIVFRSFGGQLPYTIEYKWQIKFKETQYYPPWQPQDRNESIEKATFTLDAPFNLKVYTRTLNQNFQYSELTTGGRMIQTWTVANAKAIPYEENGPPDHELLPTIYFAPAVFQVENYTGSMESWKAFGSFLYELNKGRETMSPTMSSLILQMTSNCKNEHEKIDTLYQWLQKNMRYVSVQLGIGGWQTFDAAYVEKNRYGDCKALSFFMKGMLKEVGIESWQVNIKWDEENIYFEDDFTTPYFNHVMLYVPSEKMWLECTSNDLPTGVIDIDEENKKVLLVTPEGGVISRTPVSPSQNNQIFTTDTVQLGSNSIRGTIVCQGNLQDEIRDLNYNSSAEEQRKHFLEHFPLSVKKLDKLEIHVNPNGITSTLFYAATVSQFGTVSGTRYFLPVNSIQPASVYCSSESNRKTDFISRDNYTKINDLYYKVPADYEIEFLPPPINLSYKGIQYSVNITFEEPYVHVHHQLVKIPLRLAPVDLTEACVTYDAILKSNKRMIILKKSKT
jgi:hypothetical protein